MNSQLTKQSAVGTGEVKPLSADERLLRKAVARCLKAQVAEVHGRVQDGAKVGAVPSPSHWDAAVMREVRPIWFGLFKKGGDRALKEIRRFGPHARKMVVFSKGMVEESERVTKEVQEDGRVMFYVPRDGYKYWVAGEVKGGAGSGNFGHEGRPGEVGGSGSGGGTESGLTGVSVYHGTAGKYEENIKQNGLKTDVGAAGRGVYTTRTFGEAIDYAMIAATREYGGKELPNDLKLVIVTIDSKGSEFINKDRWAIFKENIPPSGIVSMRVYDAVKVKQFMRGKDAYPTEEELEQYHLNKGVKVKLYFVPVLIKEFDKESKSFKASPSIVIPDWIEDPDVLDALEREMFKFAHGINQTTADSLRDELMAGMENGETISQLADRISGISDEWVEGWRSEMIARTETARAFSTGHIEAWRSTGVVSRKVWVAALDACPFCREMDGTVVDLDENFLDKGDEQDVPWRGETIVLGQDYSAVNGPPLHPNCITDGNVPVFTSKGWKPIRDIKEQELVLTHKGRFRKVTKAIHSVYGAGTTKITFGKASRDLTVTDDHPILVGGKWVAAKDVKRGDALSILGQPCARCGKMTMWNMKYCSHTCLSLDITDAQRADPEHRKIISRKASAQLTREYANGTRDRFEITKGMNKAMRLLGAQGLCPLQRPEVRDKIRLVTNTPTQRRISSLRMRRHNPATVPEVRARMTASYAKTMLLHPERHPNVVMAQRGFITSIERKVKELLDTIGIAYTQQHPVDRFFVDFAIPSLMVAIEVDGNYWHKDTQKDADRQAIIEGKGWYVVRFREDQINDNLQSVSQELVRIAANHAGEYKFAAVKVLKVERWKLGKPRAVYNLSVAEDESYIAKGMVVHNCRCVLIAELDEEKMVSQKGGEGSGNFGHAGRPGEVGGSGPGGGGLQSIPIVSGDISQEKQTEITTTAKELVGKDQSGDEFGFRMLPYDGKEGVVGNKLESSFHWEEGNFTGKEIGATSVVGIKNADDIEHAFDILKKSNYLGRQLALVRGGPEGSGEDIGERLLSDAEIVAVWDVGRKDLTKSS